MVWLWSPEPCGRRRKLTPTSVPLTCTHVLKVLDILPKMNNYKRRKAPRQLPKVAHLQVFPESPSIHGHDDRDSRFQAEASSALATTGGVSHIPCKSWETHIQFTASSLQPHSKYNDDHEPLPSWWQSKWRLWRDLWSVSYYICRSPLSAT